MNELFEAWSLPWHALQKSLAEAFRAEAAQPASDARPTGDKQSFGAASWLARARAATTPPLRRPG